MTRITFSPTASSIDPSILAAKSTAAKVCFNPHEIYVDATISPLGRGDRWEVEVEYIPIQVNVSETDTNAVLCLTKGRARPCTWESGIGQDPGMNRSKLCQAVAVLQKSFSEKRCSAHINSWGYPRASP